MKRLKSLTILLALLLAPVLHSCLDDENNGYISIATVKVIDGQDYYFNMESGKKMYPGDTTSIHNYKVADGQRVFVWYDLLNEVPTGYDYSAKVQGISDILTKGIIPLTEETADSIGDNRISIYNNEIWISQNYLTLRFYLAGSNLPSEPHMLNLVRNETVTHEDDGYIYLELRHNAYDDPRERILHGYVSFKLDEIAQELETAKGLKIRVNTLEYGEKTRTLTFSDVATSRAPSSEVFQGAAHLTGTVY